ncbi:response regulator transcription factor [Rhodopseudomonas palustris]|uniref:DNA-binding response regulator n=1 Tax=Rhodopseudomonas palustris TaxID=1076 RepID=A0A418VE34_RHOPL|nr:DNA-binding response regulator [Rhodopseudomonas palustris]
MINRLPPQQMVLVVDDDESMRVALTYLFRSMDLDVKVFKSAADVLDAGIPDVPCCLVLDIRLPGVSGLDFQETLAKTGLDVPIVFITGHGDIPMSVRAMKAGAVDFLTKPFRDQDMLDAVMRALAKDRERRDALGAVADLRRRYESLTPRQTELFVLVAAGLMNKQIAGRLQVSEVTVKIHRGIMMKKMAARSVADLVRMAEAIGVKAGI